MPEIPGPIKVVSQGQPVLILILNITVPKKSNQIIHFLLADHIGLSFGLKQAKKKTQQTYVILQFCLSLFPVILPTQVQVNAMELLCKQAQHNTAFVMVRKNF